MAEKMSAESVQATEDQDKTGQRLAAQKLKYARKLAFSKYVSSCSCPADPATWSCCDMTFRDVRQCHKHVSSSHQDDIEKLATDILQHGSEDAKWKPLRASKRAGDCPCEGMEDCSSCKKPHEGDGDHEELPCQLTDGDVFPWLPAAPSDEAATGSKYQVLLYYKYRDISETTHVRVWQEALCQRLKLKGKVRVSPEGLNVTVCGLVADTELYMQAVIAHPLFQDMTLEDFKTSVGTEDTFTSLRVGEHAEAVPMAVPPDACSHNNGGHHLSPAEFHNAVERHISGSSEKDAVFVDCRNFYESKIGKFQGAVTPDIRKFSYWPEYVDQNAEMFRNKQVYMYCTGGIRCERGSAYIKNKGLTQDVFQLKGGIHKYMEQYPDGYFRGKLFVFDERYSIQSNDDIIACCSYCEKPWDTYEPCSSVHCHQLVLVCPSCRQEGHTACCSSCQASHPGSREECQCTKDRARVPKDNAAVQS